LWYGFGEGYEFVVVEWVGDVCDFLGVFVLDGVGESLVVLYGFDGESFVVWVWCDVLVGVVYVVFVLVMSCSYLGLVDW